MTSYKEILYLSINYLDKKNNLFCAKNICYKRNIFIQSSVIISFFSAPITCFHMLNICYLAHNLFKIFLICYSYKYRSNSSWIPYLLPKYTILVPLYYEVGNIQILTKGLKGINYPKHLLDIIILLEEDDKETNKEVSTIIDYLFHVTVINVPKTLPRTKPKALNYGFYYSTGDYVTIYDAEDLPDTSQLLNVLQYFFSADDNLGCVQCKLNFYNSKENLLTFLFSIEYAQWFSCLLPGLILLDFPIPLSGTSNHFKRNILNKVGLWDPYNVTEDADLGLRLYMYGYKVILCNNYTLEESPVNILSWVYQRSRWVKGFLQTIIVYFKSYSLKKNFVNLFRISIYFILSVYNLLLFPIIMILVLKFPILTSYWFISLVASLLYVYLVYFISLQEVANIHSSYKINSKLKILSFFCWPFYFFFHIIASYLALFQLFFSPFKWNKTKHGVSNIVKDN